MQRGIAMRRLLLIGAVISAAGCVEPGTSPGVPTVFTLTAAQASAVDTRLDALVAGNPDLGWLADSASLVIREGGVADTTSLDIGMGGGLYYAVSLQRGVAVLPNPFATFDIILFNDLVNPTRFVVISGWGRGGTTPPDGMGAIISSPSSIAIGNVHFFAVDGGAVTHWRATAGNVLFNNGIPGGSCPWFAPANGVTCQVADLFTTTRVTASVRESGLASGSPTLDVSHLRVRGILLGFLPQPAPDR
jgi:hypothetical protein